MKRPSWERNEQRYLDEVDAEFAASPQLNHMERRQRAQSLLWRDIAAWNAAHPSKRRTANGPRG